MSLGTNLTRKTPRAPPFVLGYHLNAHSAQALPDNFDNNFAGINNYITCLTDVPNTESVHSNWPLLIIIWIYCTCKILVMGFFIDIMIQSENKIKKTMRIAKIK